MTSEWMKVMLDEIARKKAEADQARLEEQLRDDGAARDAPKIDPGASTQGL
jgi:hypothetical protein